MTEDTAEPMLVEIGEGNWVYEDSERDRLFYCPRCMNDGNMEILQVSVSTSTDGSKRVLMGCPNCKNNWRGDDPRKIGLSG